MDKGTSASEDAGLEGGWIVMSHIGWRGEQNTIYKGVETFPYQIVGFYVLKLIVGKQKHILFLIKLLLLFIQ